MQSFQNRNRNVKDEKRELVIGIYSNGKATYRMINTTTDETREEEVSLGALIPTTNEWNLVVEIPSS